MKPLLAILLFASITYGQGGMGPGPGVKAYASSGSTLLTSLSASWKFDESSGNAADSSGNATTLTNNNTTTYNTGLINNASYYLTASSQYMSAASNSFVQAGDVDFSIGFCFYIPAAASGVTSIILSKRGQSSGQDEYVAYYFGSSDGLLHFQVFKATDSGVDVAAVGAISTDTWHCAVAWHDATANTVNISLDNATPVSQATGGALQAASNGQFAVGRQDESGGEFYATARIDNVNIWKKVLSSTERTCFWNSGASAQYPFTGLCP